MQGFGDFSNSSGFGPHGHPEPKPQHNISFIRTSRKATASLVLGLLSFVFSIITAIPAILFGVLALRDVGRQREKLGGRGRAIAGLVFGCVGLLCFPVQVAVLLPSFQAAREAARRIESSEHLKKIGLVLHNHHDTYHVFPLTHRGGPPEWAPEDAHPAGLSWRVHVLPFLDREDLYERFHLDEPWDSPHNRSLLAEMPEVYKTPGVQLPEGHTAYLGVAGPDGIFGAEEPLNFSAITDGSSYTSMVVEANREAAVPWTKPADWDVNLEDPLAAPAAAPGLRQAMGALPPDGFLTLFSDGSIHFIPNSTDDETLRHYFNYHDGYPVELPGRP